VPLDETLAALRRFAGATPIVSLGRGADAEQFLRLWRVLCGGA
jgi:hypothetical protein